MDDGCYYDYATQTAGDVLQEITSVYQTDLLDIRWRDFVNLLRG